MRLRKLEHGVRPRSGAVPEAPTSARAPAETWRDDRVWDTAERVQDGRLVQGAFSDGLPAELQEVAVAVVRSVRAAWPAGEVLSLVEAGRVDAWLAAAG